LKNEREKKKKKKNHKKTTQSREEPKKQKNGKLKMGRGPLLRGPLPPARVRAFIRPAPRRGICFSLQKKGGEYVLAN
jgi:hypothetical protein